LFGCLVVWERLSSRDTHRGWTSFTPRITGMMVI
jgi:hypothetical protein